MKTKKTRHYHRYRCTETPGLQKCEHSNCGQLKRFDYKTQTYKLINY